MYRMNVGLFLLLSALLTTVVCPGPQAIKRLDDPSTASIPLKNDVRIKQEPIADQENIYYFTEGETLTLKCQLAKPHLGKLLGRYKGPGGTLRRSFFWSINDYQYTTYDLEQDFAHIRLSPFPEDSGKSGTTIPQTNVSTPSSPFERQLAQFDLRIYNITGADEGNYFCGLRRNHKMGSAGYISNVTRLIKIVPYGRPLLRSGINSTFVPNGAHVTYVIPNNRGIDRTATVNETFGRREPFSEIRRSSLSASYVNAINLTCVVPEGRPVGRIEWVTDPSLKSRILFGPRDYKDTSSMPGTGPYGYEETQLQVYDVGPEDQGKSIWCQVYQIVNGKRIGMIRSQISLDILYAPVIKHSEKEGTTDAGDKTENVIYVREGGPLDTYCEARANPKPKILWWLSNKNGNFVISEMAYLSIQNLTSDWLFGRSNPDHKSESDQFQATPQLTTDDPYLTCQASNDLGSTYWGPVTVRFDSNKAPFTNWENRMPQKLMIISVICIVSAALIITMICLTLSKKRILFSRKFIDKKLPIVAKNEERYRVYNPHKSSLSKSMNRNTLIKEEIIKNGTLPYEGSNGTKKDKDVQINTISAPHHIQTSKYKENQNNCKSRWEDENSFSDNSHLRRINNKINPTDMSINHSILSIESTLSPIVPLASIDSESFLDLSFEEAECIAKATPTQV